MSSFCYNLVSLGDPTHTTSYIGETNNLAHRFAVHNQRQGAQTTRDIALIPWALLGFVTGFEGNDRSERQRFEAAWKALRNAREVVLRRKLKPHEIGGLAVMLIQSDSEYKSLAYVRCGEVRHE
jgi:predicted GIY-YIG superfamily endonuclease